MLNKTAKLIFLCAFSVFPHLLPAAEEQASNFVVTNRSNEWWHAQSALGRVKIDLRRLQVEVKGPYGKAVPERILILFEPKSGAFSWSVFDEDSLATNKSRQMRALETNVLASERSLLSYLYGCNFAELVCSEHSRPCREYGRCRGKSIDGSGGFSQATQPRRRDATLAHCAVAESLGRDFVSPPMSAQISLTPKVIGVQWDGQHWEVTLQGQWTEAITLDSSYSLVAMHKVKIALPSKIA